MKASNWYIIGAFLVAFGLTSTLTTRAYGQNSVSGSSGDGQNQGIESPIPENMLHVPSGGDVKPPADWFIPLTEEEQRFRGFFISLRNWNELAKKLEDSGDSGWADHYRTKLERESGLTSSESAEVTKIVLQYFQDDKNDENVMLEIRSRAIADSPNSWKSVIYSDAEYVALYKHKSNLLNQAIGQLVSTLGSRPFTKLDLYTRHYKDQMKAAQARKQAESSQGGAQK